LMQDADAPAEGGEAETRGYLAHAKEPPPYDCHRAIDIGVLQGPKGAPRLLR